MVAVVIQRELERREVLPLECKEWQEQSVEESQPHLVLPVLPVR